MSASREARLQRYAELLRKWNPAINLIAPNTVADLEYRHIEDSLQLAELVREPGEWLDIGSGGGLPGIVSAIVHPDWPVTLVDSDRRKVTFLQTCIRELELPHCQAVVSRIEALPPASARHLSARALAPLDRLMPYLERHLGDQGTAWLMKGRNWRAELDQLGGDIAYNVTVHPSKTDPDAAIIQFDRKTRG